MALDSESVHVWREKIVRRMVAAYHVRDDWRIMEEDLLLLTDSQVIRFCRYQNRKLTLGFNFMEKMHTYYYPEGVVEQ